MTYYLYLVSTPDQGDLNSYRKFSDKGELIYYAPPRIDSMIVCACSKHQARSMNPMGESNNGWVLDENRDQLIIIKLGNAHPSISPGVVMFHELYDPENRH